MLLWAGPRKYKSSVREEEPPTILWSVTQASQGRGSFGDDPVVFWYYDYRRGQTAGPDDERVSLKEEEEESLKKRKRKNGGGRRRGGADI